MTFTLLRLGEPQLQGHPKGGPVVDPCPELEGTERFTTSHGGMEEVNDEVSLSLPLEIPWAYSTDYATPGGNVNGRVYGVRSGNARSTLFNLIDTNPWANNNFPHGGWVGAGSVQHRQDFENLYQSGGIWKLDTTRSHSGTYSLRAVQGYQENPVSPPSGQYFYEQTYSLTPMSGLLCETILVQNDSPVEGGHVHPPYSAWVTEGEVITFEWWGFQGYFGPTTDPSWNWEPYWAARFVYMGGEPGGGNDVTDDSHHSLSGPTSPDLVMSFGVWEKFSVSSTVPLSGACQIHIQQLLVETSFPDPLDTSREWLHVDDARILVA